MTVSISKSTQDVLNVVSHDVSYVSYVFDDLALIIDETNAEPTTSSVHGDSFVDPLYQ